jgi:hypothetical protein
MRFLQARDGVWIGRTRGNSLAGPLNCPACFANVRAADSVAGDLERIQSRNFLCPDCGARLEVFVEEPCDSTKSHQT